MGRIDPLQSAPDGSPVELYRRLPERTADAELVDGLLQSQSTVLDLGCATGRLAEPLARLGHRVTGVDNEPAMLASLHQVRGVRADIDGLHLGTEFDAVLLMSHLINSADDGFVDQALHTVRRHVRRTGFAVVERYPVGWVSTCAENSREVDGVGYTLTDIERDGDVVTATVGYEFGGMVAHQRFTAREMHDSRLDDLAADAGLQVTQALDDARTMIVMRPR